MATKKTGVLSLKAVTSGWVLMNVVNEPLGSMKCWEIWLAEELLVSQ